MDSQQLDRLDPLARFRAEFDLPDGVIYLDGNSLGPLPHRTKTRIREVSEHEWGTRLIRGWTESGWMELPTRVGDKIARLVGAPPGTVVVADSTSVNLYKALSLALAVDPRRGLLVSDRGNFPTDLYVAEGLLRQLGARHELLLVDGDEEAIERVLSERGDEVAAVFHTHVNFTTARVFDMRRITSAAHAVGAVALWDLSHSAGALAIDLDGCDVDFAVGCGYKYLNGGPGAPAFLFGARRWQHLAQPLSGWMGHARPFDFGTAYEPAPGARRLLSGTPTVIALSALESSVDVMLQASLDEIRRKSIALGDLFVGLVDRHCAGKGLELASPCEATRRGSHVSYRHPRSGEVMARLVERGVIGDCRPPDLLRFGFAPLYLRYRDIEDAVRILAECC